VDEQQRARLAKTYKQDANKDLAPAICHFVTPDATVRAEPEPSGGLFSTGQDYATFLQMIASGGELQGTRILSKQSVDTMTRPHVINGQPLGYGLGWGQVRRPANSPGLEGFGHGGAFSTNGLIDPKRELVTVLMIQRTLFDNGGDVLNAFQELVFKAIR
jgi:CubicO group peptidase (beta-lactamase class C family)